MLYEIMFTKSPKCFICYKCTFSITDIELEVFIFMIRKTPAFISLKLNANPGDRFSLFEIFSILLFLISPNYRDTMSVKKSNF